MTTRTTAHGRWPRRQDRVRGLQAAYRTLLLCMLLPFGCGTQDKAEPVSGDASDSSTDVDVVDEPIETDIDADDVDADDVAPECAVSVDAVQEAPAFLVRDCEFPNAGVREFDVPDDVPAALSRCLDGSAGFSLEAVDWDSSYLAVASAWSSQTCELEVKRAIVHRSPGAVVLDFWTWDHSRGCTDSCDSYSSAIIGAIVERGAEVDDCVVADGACR